MSSAVRIVSLLPSATEIVCLLGRQDSLVAVSHECDFPSGIRRLPRVVHSSFDSATLPQNAIDEKVREALQSGRSLYSIDADLLTSLAPDLVLTQRLCDVCAVPYDSVLAAVHKLSVAPRVLSLHPHSIHDVLEDIGRVGDALGASDRAEREVARLSRRLSAVEEGLREVSSRPRVAALEWLDPIMASGHWVVEMIERAGGEDFLGRRGEPSVYVAWDEVLRYGPEVLVLMPCGFDVERAVSDSSLLSARAGWESLPAVRTGQVYAVDGNSYFNRSGPGLIDGIEILAEILHPEVFAWRDRSNAYRRLGVEGVLA